MKKRVKNRRKRAIILTGKEEWRSGGVGIIGVYFNGT